MIHAMYRIPLSIPVGNQDHHKGATTKRTVSEGPSHDILVQVGHSRLAWLREVSIASFSHGILITDLCC